MWVAFGLQPHRSQTFKLSSDPLFVDKVRDIVGLYLSPPNRALVLSIDEKSQIQALDREQPVLPMMPGVTERRTHSYVRHGTTSLFAALDVASGFVIGKCYKRHRAAEFLNFLKEIDAQLPEGLDIHIVMDNYATHKTPKIKTWLARRPHYHVHFTPTSSSWINQVERWFAELTRKRLRRGVHTSVRQLEADIRAFIDHHNQNPRPFKWTKSADQILASNYVESQPPRNACRIAAAGPDAGVFASDPALARWGWLLPAACALSSDIAGPTRRCLACDLLHVSPARALARCWSSG